MSKADELGYELYPYQKRGVEFLRSHNRAYLADDMGLGKTVQAILSSEGETLVVAPAMLVDAKVWEKEVDLWADDPDRFTITAFSRVPDRNGRKQAPRPREELLKTWDTVIIDEAHYIKNPKAIRTRALLRVLKTAKKVYLLSGSPVPNWASELFVPLQILYPEDARPGRKYGSYWGWVEDWFKVTENPFSRGALDVGRLRGCTPKCDKRALDDPCEHYLNFQKYNLGDKFLRRLRDDVLPDLPLLQQINVKIPMTTKQWTEYRRMKKDFIAEVDDDEVVSWSVAARHTRLDQITTGLGIIGNGPDKTTHSGKFERLASDLSERVKPTIVVGHYRSTVQAAEAVSRKLGKTTQRIDGGTPQKERAKIVENFQEGKIDVLVVTYDTVSEGLTLTAADTMIMLEKSYKAVKNEQMVRRIHRLGQKHPCLVLDYISVGPSGQATLDGNKRRILEKKKRGQEHTLSGATLKEIL